MKKKVEEFLEPEIEVLDPDCRALKDFSYDGEEFPVFREGDPLQLRQGGEVFYVWDAAHERFLYTTRSLDWLFEYLAFYFQRRKDHGVRRHARGRSKDGTGG